MNEVRLLGRVGSIDLKYNETTAKPVAKISIGVPNGKKSDDGKTLYDNFYVAFFNSAKVPTAEKLVEVIKEGDYIRIAGKLTINKYKKNPDDEKYTYDTQIVGFGFKKVIYDDFERKYIDA